MTHPSRHNLLVHKINSLLICNPHLFQGSWSPPHLVERNTGYQKHRRECHHPSQELCPSGVRNLVVGNSSPLEEVGQDNNLWRERISIFHSFRISDNRHVHSQVARWLVKLKGGILLGGPPAPASVVGIQLGIFFLMKLLFKTALNRINSNWQRSSFLLNIGMNFYKGYFETKWSLSEIRNAIVWLPGSSTILAFNRAPIPVAE